MFVCSLSKFVANVCMMIEERVVPFFLCFYFFFFFFKNGLGHFFRTLQVFRFELKASFRKRNWASFQLWNKASFQCRSMGCFSAKIYFMAVFTTGKCLWVHKTVLTMGPTAELEETT